MGNQHLTCASRQPPAGREGEGFVAMKGLDGGRINIATCSVGAAQGALGRQRYMQEAQQFGKPIASFQALQFKLADMTTRRWSPRARWCTWPQAERRRTRRLHLLRHGQALHRRGLQRHQRRPATAAATATSRIPAGAPAARRPRHRSWKARTKSCVSSSADACWFGDAPDAIR